MTELVKDMQRTKCHDCGCEVGERHMLGCDMERCPKCKMQLIGCGCFTRRQFRAGGLKKESIGGYEREKWSGIAYEKEMLYAEKHDLWVYWGPPWISCSKDHPEATHDLNKATRLMQQEL